MSMRDAPISMAQLPAGKFVTLAKVQPVGSLQARKQRSGATSLYWRYSFGDASERVLIGLYDSKAPPKSVLPTPDGRYSVTAAMRAAQDLAQQHHASRDDGGRPEVARRQKVEKANTDKVTLKALLDSYCDYLQALGRRSHLDARSIFRLHVFEAFDGKKASKRAADVTGEDIADIMRRLIEVGKGRTANKLRSYVHAAYAVARKSRTSPSIPESFKAFRITSNPASETEADGGANRSDKKPLDLPQMRTYWRSIKSREDFKGTVLQVHLLTGAQRIEQLVKLLSEDAHEDHVVLHDGKGRPGKPPREHKVPLIGHARRALARCKAEGHFVISTDGGETHVAATTLSRWAAEAAETAQIAGFQTKRLRSGVETALAAAGIPLEDRGRLQSHGVAGVQARHYDGHDYLPVKRNALEVLWNLLEDRPRRTSHDPRARGRTPTRE